MTLNTIDLIPGTDADLAAFDARKMQLARISGVELSDLLGRNLACFAQLVTEGRGFGIIVRDGTAQIFGLSEGS